MTPFTYIKADPFFRDFLPEVKSHKYKIRGFNSRGSPAEFSKEEKAKIKKALASLLIKNNEI